MGALLVVGALLLAEAARAGTDPKPPPFDLAASPIGQMWLKLAQTHVDKGNKYITEQCARRGRPNPELSKRPTSVTEFDPLTQRILRVMSSFAGGVQVKRQGLLEGLVGVDAKGMEWKLTPQGFGSELETKQGGGQSAGGRTWTVKTREGRSTHIACFFKVGEKLTPLLKKADYRAGQSGRRNIYLYETGAYSHELVTGDNRERSGMGFNIPGVIVVRKRDAPTAQPQRKH
jgi:hypothetical protein